MMSSPDFQRVASKSKDILVAAQGSKNIKRVAMIQQVEAGYETSSSSNGREQDQPPLHSS